MKQLSIIVNPDFQEDEKPGQFLEIKIKVKDDCNRLTVQREIFKRLRYTVTEEINIEIDEP
jgi:hypothetical protein